MAISDYFKNSFETGTDQSNPKLQIHYYGSDYYKTQNALNDLMKKEGFKLLHTDNHYQEMLFEKKKIQVIVTFNEIGMYETSVSLKVNTHYLFPMAKGLKWIEQFYQKLDRVLVVKHKGNYNG